MEALGGLMIIKSGMEMQLISLAQLGVLGTFVGMLTDSRSFLSYTRHDYFRRILCNLLGRWVEAGEYPQDETALERVIGGFPMIMPKATLTLSDEEECF